MSWIRYLRHWTASEITEYCLKKFIFSLILNWAWVLSMVLPLSNRSRHWKLFWKICFARNSRRLYSSYLKFTQSPKKLPFKEFIFMKAVGFYPAASLKINSFTGNLKTSVYIPKALFSGKFSISSQFFWYYPTIS